MGCLPRRPLSIARYFSGVMAFGSVTSLLAQTPSLPSENLEKLLDQKVVSASKALQPISDTPAITTIITQEEIRNSGYVSVAEALKTVPGFYGIHDYLGENTGIRGVHAGARGYSRILKVLIDGQAVSFRFDGTCFLGPELIPMEAVDRIEVIRGPASALYGADAYLGTVHIITKEYARRVRGILRLHNQWMGGKPGQSAEILAEAGQDRWGFFAAASSGRLDRSGIRLPEQSPITKVQNVQNIESREDIQRYKSLYAKAAYSTERTTTECIFHGFRLSSMAEWVDFSPISHGNRVVLSSGHFLIRNQVQVTDRLDFNGSAAFARGAPGREERLSSTTPGLQLRRDMGYESLDLRLEARYRFRDRDSLLLGVDRSEDQHDLLNVIAVDASNGRETPMGIHQGSKRFLNTGIYAQLISHLVPNLDLTANLRQDRQNIYGNNLSHRISLVFRFTPSLYSKLLNGTAFKAPTAYQLYAQPLYFMELQGNPKLETERAQTWEAEVGWEPSSHLLLKSNIFFNEVKGMIVFVPRGAFVPTNTGRTRSKGIEAELTARVGRQRLLFGGAWQKTRNQNTTPFQGDLESPSPSYPSASASLRWQYWSGDWGFFELGGRWASPRRASESNIFWNHLVAYSLPSYGTAHLAYHLEGEHWRLNLRIDNLLNRRWAEPGYRGYDLPGQARRVDFSCAWTF